MSEELKNAIAAGRALIGARSVLRNIMAGKISSVIIATNCPTETAADIKKLAAMSAIKIETFSGTGKQLGTLCGKPFPISVAGIKGRGKGEK